MNRIEGGKNMEEKYIQSELRYEKMNEGITYAEGDPYIKSSMENCSRNPMNVVRFKYSNEEQQARIYKAINDCLMGYGATSFRAKNGGSYIMPYFVDENGDATYRTTGIIGGVGLPKDLVVLFIERFVELDGCKVKIGDEEIVEKCPENLSKIISDLKTREDEER